MLTPGDAEDTKVGGCGGIWEGEESRVEAWRRATNARAGAAREEGGDGDGDEQQQRGEGAVGGAQASVRGMRLPGLGLVVLIHGVGGGGAREGRRGGRGPAGCAGGEACVVHFGGERGTVVGGAEIEMECASGSDTTQV